MEKNSTLSKSRLCVGMTPQEVQELAPFIQSYHLEAGKEIYEEGDTEAFLCLIVSGTANVYKSSEISGETSIAELNVGETIGEMAVIDELPRSASARAITEMTLYAFTRKNLLEFYGKSPQAWSKLIHNIAVLLCHRLREANKFIENVLLNNASNAEPIPSKLNCIPEES